MTQTVTSVDLNGNTYEVPISNLEWRVSAYGIVIQGENVLLLPAFDDNTYSLPGGGVDLGELPEQGVIREVKEETGLDVAAPRLVDGRSCFFTFAHDATPEPVSVQSVLLYYACEFVGGELSTDGFDEYEKAYARMAVWFPIAELDSIELASSEDWRDIVRQVAAT